MKKLSEMSQNEVKIAIKKQREIEQQADIDYDLYASKLNFSDWWQVKLWDNIKW